jgi:hypothetical protein
MRRTGGIERQARFNDLTWRAGGVISIILGETWAWYAMAFETSSGVASRDIKGQKMVERASLWEPYLIRRHRERAQRSLVVSGTRGHCETFMILSLNPA